MPITLVPSVTFNVELAPLLEEKNQIVIAHGPVTLKYKKRFVGRI